MCSTAFLTCFVRCSISFTEFWLAQRLGSATADGRGFLDVKMPLHEYLVCLKPSYKDAFASSALQFTVATPL